MKSPTVRPAVLLIAFLAAGTVRAADVTWTNGSGDFAWNTTSPNWSGAAWNNAAGDAAVFGGTGVGTVGVPGAVTARSLDFRATGYTLSGAGGLNLTAAGSGTLGAGTVNVAGGATARIDTAITSTVGLQKLGAGVLELGGTNNITGAFPITSDGRYTADVMIGPSPLTALPGVSAGTLRLLTPGALAPTATVAIGSGYLDIGANDVTLANLRFNDVVRSAVWNTTLNANNGVVGSGTLRVTGEITSNGTNNGPGGIYAGNTVATNLDLGGGTQVVRVSRGLGVSSSSPNLMFTGSLSNGSLLKTAGLDQDGAVFGSDGLSLFGNNTYTGSTVLIGGYNLATGTNASTSLKVVAGKHSLFGADGSYLAATTIRVYSGELALDNSNGTHGNGQPSVLGALNNNRIRDDAAVELRDSVFSYSGASSTAAAETYGSLYVSGGHADVRVYADGSGGTVTLTATGGLALATRSTLRVGATLGGSARMFFNGGVPAADPTGILPRVVSADDFLTYNAATGLTPFAGYASDFNTPNANVALTIAATANTQTVNALKTSGGATVTVAAGSTLTVSSGMILGTGGSLTINGGTLAFGDKPGVLFASPNHYSTISSALTGTVGLIAATGSTTLSGDLSGLSGTLTVNSGSVILNTNTFAGPIEVRTGTLGLGKSLGPGGAISLGVPQNGDDPGGGGVLDLSAAGTNATFARAIVTANGADGGGSTIRPLLHSAGSQTISGNITLNTDLGVHGGNDWRQADGGAGSTNFTGTITGAGAFSVVGSKVAFLPGSLVSNTGGFVVGNGDEPGVVTFAGATSGTAPITINVAQGTRVSYAPGSLPTGTITIRDPRGFSGIDATSLVPLAISTIGNAIVLNSDLVADVGSGITGTWAGVLSGTGTLTKSGTGTLILSNGSNTHTGPVTVSAGRLSVSGTLGGASTVTVNSGGTFGGSGTVSRNVTVNAGGTLAPGGDAAIGTLTVNGAATLTGAAPGTGAVLSVRAARGGSANTVAANDQLSYAGSLNFVGLDTGTPGAGSNKFRVQIVSDAANPLVSGETYTLTLAQGTGQIQRNGTQVNAAAYTFNVNDYELSSPTFSSFNSVSLAAGADGRLVLSFSPVPEPASVFGVGGAMLAAGAFVRRRLTRRR